MKNNTQNTIKTGQDVDVETMLDAYIECALWSSVHFEDEDDNCGTPMDSLCNDIHDSCMDAMRKDCNDFLALCDREGADLEGWSDEQLGHDFWLTRNGHGVGFWDRGMGESGEVLTRLAKTYGSADLYVGDDGMIYCE